MATLRNKQKLAAFTRERQEEHPRNGQSRNTSVPRINEEYIAQVSEEIEGRVTKKPSQEISRTESRILGALSNLDEFLLSPQIRTHSGTVPGIFRNTNVENEGTNEDDSQSDPHSEGGLFRSQTTQNSGPEAGHYMVTGVGHYNTRYFVYHEHPQKWHTHAGSFFTSHFAYIPWMDTKPQWRQIESTVKILNCRETNLLFVWLIHSLETVWSWLIPARSKNVRINAKPSHGSWPKKTKN